MNTHPTHTLSITILSAFFPILLFTACSANGNRFKLEGNFKNINQGEFFLYNLEAGTKDTIAVNDGHFNYEVLAGDSTTLTLLFPNYSEIPVFAAPGVSLTMQGDVSHLRETEVTGNKENELMTSFRLKVADMTPSDTEAQAVAFIEENPQSVVSNYLLHRYILQSTEPDYTKAYDLCTKLHEAQPMNQHLARLHTQLELLKNQPANGQKLNSFTVTDTKGNTVTEKQLDGDVNVIVVWASWNYESQGTLQRLRNLQKFLGSSLKVISISVDASPAEGKTILERDSITWPNICDGTMWMSPLLTAHGICSLPANIVMDSEGNIIERNLPNGELDEKIKKAVNL